MSVGRIIAIAIVIFLGIKILNIDVNHMFNSVMTFFTEVSR